VGWLYAPGILVQTGEDPVRALERAGDFVIYAQLSARDVLDGLYDVAGVLRALSRFHDGPVCIVSSEPDSSDYDEALELIMRVVPDSCALRSTNDYTRMAFPGSVALPLNGDGYAELDPCTAVLAGSVGTWTVTHTVGPRGIANGGKVRVSAGHDSDWGRGQTTHPDQLNYITCHVVGDARLRAQVSVQFIPCADWTWCAEARVTEGELLEGDSIRVVFGDSSGGSPGYRCQTFEESTCRLFVSVDNEGDGLFRETPNPPSFSVVGGAPVHIKLIAPAIVRPGEPFSLLIRSEDQYLNVSTVEFSPQIALEAVGPVDNLPDNVLWPDQGRAIARIEGLSCKSEGIFYIRAKDPKSRAIGLSTPIKCAANGPKLFWGDIHAHSYLMDGTGTPEDNFRYARDVAGLDFFSLADHCDIDGDLTQISRPEQWELVKEQTRRFYEPGRFVTLLGYELAQEEGDYNVYYRTDDADWFIPATTPWELFRWLRARRLEAVVIPHMTTYPVPVRGYDLNYYDPEFVKLIEITSCHGTGDFFGGPRPLCTCQPGGYVQEALARGHRLGLMGSSDGHQGKPGNTRQRYDNGLIGVYAQELTRDAVFDAMKRRHCYAATNARIVLEFEINQVPMGQDLSLWEPTRFKHIRLSVAGTAPLKHVDILKNNQVIFSPKVAGLTYEGRWVDETPTSREDYYVLRVAQTDGEMAWSSPIWVSGGDRLPTWRG